MKRSWFPSSTFATGALDKSFCNRPTVGLASERERFVSRVIDDQTRLQGVPTEAEFQFELTQGASDSRRFNHCCGPVEADVLSAAPPIEMIFENVRK